MGGRSTGPASCFICPGQDSRRDDNRATMVRQVVGHGNILPGKESWKFVALSHLFLKTFKSKEK